VEPSSVRVALVTGGSSGLGKGVATALATAGYRTAFTYRAGGTGPDAALGAIRARGADAFPVQADFAQPGAGTQAVARALDHFGRLDVLVHAAGPIVVQRFERSTREDLDRMLETNLGSAADCAFAALPGMRARGFGRLVFFGMNGSHVTQPARGMSLYGAAKAGVVTLARTLALEEARYGITVNVIEPGDIRDKEADREAARLVPATNPTGHAGSWEDIAYAVRFLIADDAGFINGATIGVNGGLVESHE
jgi:3-oxoacyl-[acyl-carrier protein] reductase